MQPLGVSNYCEKERKPCVRWVENYFKDCLCNINDDVSFGLGLISLLCWGVAEIPQIITNYKNKSGHGVSLIFLSTWIIGDIFNLAGCFLEEATLPTQLYTALLYTTITIVLVLQCIYYDHFLTWWKSRNIEVEDEKKPLRSNFSDPRRPPLNASVDVPRRREIYYTSARSMAGSATPPIHSYIKAKSGPPVLEVMNSDSSSEDEETRPNTNIAQTPDAPPRRSQPWRIPRSVGYGTFLAATAHLPYQTRGFTHAYMKLSGRKLLQEKAMESNALGQWLGWLMAAIYMGGRIPQIWLNMKRGSVEGLNPLMFLLALFANATYSGSILVRNTEWEKIKANMPWLLDAIACVALDLFILLQYVYYKFIKRDKVRSVEEYYQECGRVTSVEKF